MTSDPTRTTAAWQEGELAPPDQPTDFVRLPCPEHGCGCVGVGVDERDAREALHHHTQEDHRD